VERGNALVSYLELTASNSFSLIVTTA